MPIKLLVAVVAIHLGFGFTQMTAGYFGGDVADYGAAGSVSHTPIGTFIDLEPERAPQGDQGNLERLKSMLDFANNVGDMINGLASFRYGVLTDIQDGFVYNIVAGFRLVSAFMWIAAGMAMIYFLFDSNLLTSKLGLSLVGLGLGAGALSAVGAAI